MARKPWRRRLICSLGRLATPNPKTPATAMPSRATSSTRRLFRYTNDANTSNILPSLTWNIQVIADLDYPSQVGYDRGRGVSRRLPDLLSRGGSPQRRRRTLGAANRPRPDPRTAPLLRAAQGPRRHPDRHPRRAAADPSRAGGRAAGGDRARPALRIDRGRAGAGPGAQRARPLGSRPAQASLRSGRDPDARPAHLAPPRRRAVSAPGKRRIRGARGRGDRPSRGRRGADPGRPRQRAGDHDRAEPPRNEGTHPWRSRLRDRRNRRRIDPRKPATRPRLAQHPHRTAASSRATPTTRSFRRGCTNGRSVAHQRLRPEEAEMRDAARMHARWRAATGQQTPPTTSWSDERPAASAPRTL